MFYFDLEVKSKKEGNAGFQRLSVCQYKKDWNQLSPMMSEHLDSTKEPPETPGNPEVP